jgi:hypothetical protein
MVQHSHRVSYSCVFIPHGADHHTMFMNDHVSEDDYRYYLV